jgi:hypothetical protein
MNAESEDDKVIPFRKRGKGAKKAKTLPQAPQFATGKNVRFEVGSDGKMRITSLVEVGSKEAQHWALQINILQHHLLAQSIQHEVFTHKERSGGSSIDVPDTIVLDLSPLIKTEPQ